MSVFYDEQQRYILQKSTDAIAFSADPNVEDTITIKLHDISNVCVGKKWKKADLDLWWHRVNRTPEQAPNRPPVEIWAQRVIIGWRIVKDGIQASDVRQAPTVEDGVVISPYCSGTSPSIPKNTPELQPVSKNPTVPAPTVPRGPTAPPAPTAFPPAPVAPKAAPTLPQMKLNELKGGGDIIYPDKRLDQNGIGPGD